MYWTQFDFVAQRACSKSNHIKNYCSDRCASTLLHNVDEIWLCVQLPTLLGVEVVSFEMGVGIIYMGTSDPNIWWAEGQIVVDVTSPHQYFKISSLSTYTGGWLHSLLPWISVWSFDFCPMKYEKWPKADAFNHWSIHSLTLLLQLMFPNGGSSSLYCRGNMETIVVLSHWEFGIVYFQYEI